MSRKMTVEERARTMRDEHLANRDDLMLRARRWRAYALDHDDIGGLFQADEVVRSARRCNHHAVALQRFLTEEAA